jgi:hypothetical protein
MMAPESILRQTLPLRNTIISTLTYARVEMHSGEEYRAISHRLLALDNRSRKAANSGFWQAFAICPNSPAQYKMNAQHRST